MATDVIPTQKAHSTDHLQAFSISPCSGDGYPPPCCQVSATSLRADLTSVGIRMRWSPYLVGWGWGGEDGWCGEERAEMGRGKGRRCGGTGWVWLGLGVIDTVCLGWVWLGLGVIDTVCLGRVWLGLGVIDTVCLGRVSSTLFREYRM